MSGRIGFAAAIGIIFANVAAAAVEPEYQFQSPSITGQQVEVTVREDKAIYVVVFLGVECPMARLYVPRLSSLADDFGSDGVRVIGVYSNQQDSYADIKKCAEQLQPSFPVVHDVDHRIADRFQATRTPEAFVLSGDLELKYHGRIDDQFRPGVKKSEPGRSDLRVAVEELLAGKPVSVAETRFQGCVIGRVAKTDAPELVPNDITYAQHVVPVLRKHCIECHRTGEIAPFAMEDYGEVAGWADTMLETIDNRRMPPWHANPNHGTFLNQRQMPESDKQTLRDWVAGGRKPGNLDSIPPLPALKHDWQLPTEPDLVLPMRSRPYQVPADGVVEYQYFVVDPGFTEDKWISAAQVVPGNRSVVHHAIVFIRPPDGRRMKGVGWLSAYVPGQRLVQLPPGSARFVPAGSKFVFQMHYTPTGEAAEDVSKVALVFADESEVQDEVITLIAINQDFEIPPNEPRHQVEAEVNRLPEQGRLLAVAPHMHYRGRSFQLFADEDSQAPLLDVPRYDFNWQHSYAFAEPPPLENLSELRIRVQFDNSPDNPFNPDPDEWVTWGDQTWEEMAVAFFEVAVPRKQTDSKQRKTKPARRDDKLRRKQIEAYVQRAFEKMDADGDGIIRKDEVPIVARRFSFNRLDLNADGTLTREELETTAERIYPATR